MHVDLSLRKRTSGLTAALIAAALALGPAVPVAPVHAQQSKGPNILRDTETERLLAEYTRPILRVAGLEKQNIRMVIINDPTFNAFVADGHRIFVNYGAILQSETPNQLIGVLAHETGHLAGGHLAKLHQQLAQAQTQMVLAMLLGAGAIVAGASSHSSGVADAGAAAVAAPQEMIRRSLLSYQRQQEESADKAGVKFLNATGQSPKGMYETFKRLTDQALCAGNGFVVEAVNDVLPKISGTTQGELSVARVDCRLPLDLESARREAISPVPRPINAAPSLSIARCSAATTISKCQ